MVQVQVQGVHTAIVYLQTVPLPRYPLCAAEFRCGASPVVINNCDIDVK